jgi:hypothetical protein
VSETTLRLVEPRDIPTLLHKLAEQNLRDGTHYPLPEIFDEDGRQADNIPLAYVVERGGEVFGAIVFESKGVEMMLVGCNPRVTLTVGKHAPGVLYTLRAMGFNWIRCLVTRKIVKQVKDAMKEAGFRRDDGRFASFFREI